MFDKTVSSFLKKHGVIYDGNINKSLNELKESLNKEIVQDMIDITPLQTEVSEKKEEVMSNRDLLRKILKEKLEKK